MSAIPSNEPSTPTNERDEAAKPFGPRLRIFRQDGTIGDTEPQTPDEPGYHWNARAEELAEWAMEYMVNRTDAMGRYSSLESRRADPGGDKVRCDKSEVTLAKLEAHFRGINPAHIMGPYSTAIRAPREGEDRHSFWCKWGAIDIDRHDDKQDPGATLRYALHLYDRLTKLGFRVILEDSNGDGGYHLILLFEEPVPCDRVYGFLRSIICDWKDFGLDGEPETFPKQSELRKKDEAWGYGNFLRLFGRHHTKNHWSKFYDGNEWLEGDRAIEWILATKGISPSVIPDEALTNRSTVARPIRPSAPGVSRGPVDAYNDVELVRDALRYLSHRADQYDEWLDVGMALHSMGIEGQPLWEEFSRCAPDKHQEEDCSEKWATFSNQPGGLTLGSLYFWAKQAGWVRPNPRTTGPIYAQKKINRSTCINLERVLSYIEECNSDGQYDNILGREFLLIAARLKDCNPGGYLQLKNRLKAAKDRRFGIVEFDDAVKKFRNEAKEANNEEMKKRYGKAYNQKPGKANSKDAGVKGEPAGDGQAESSGAQAKQTSSDGEDRVYSEADIDDMMKDHRREAVKDRNFRNYNTILVEKRDEEGRKMKVPVTQPLSIFEIAQQLDALCPSWPKRVGGKPFVRGIDGNPMFLEKSPSQFVSWIDRLAMVDWQRGPTYITQERLYEYYKTEAEAYDAIELMPHTPSVPGIYYMHRELMPSTKKLDEFIDHFYPFTPEDRALIKSAIMTPSWGGLPGKRPAFLFTGPDGDKEGGRGSGKSTFLDIVADMIYGGSIELKPGEDFDHFKTRILSKLAAHLKIIRLDNLKTHRFSWADLENLITCPTISGHDMYHGEGRRPNLLTTMMTLNGPMLSKDMAQRVIIVKLARPPKFDASWDERVRDFGREHRWAILSEIADILAQPIPTTFGAKTRWSSWEAGVLSKVDPLGESQATILQRQGAVDNDDEERDIVQDCFARKIETMGYDPESERFFMSSALAAEWLHEATRTRRGTAQSSGHINELRIPEITQVRKGSGMGRGFFWTGTNYRGSENHFTSLDDARTSYQCNEPAF